MKDIIIFDLDGTLADIEHRRHLVTNGNNRWDEFYLACDKDAVNEPIAEIARVLCFNYIIIIFSGRSEIAMTKTDAWLDSNAIPYEEIYMRPRGDSTPDDILKQKWLNEIGKERIFCVFDDRQKVVDMWRRNGIICLQVAEGNF